MTRSTEPSARTALVVPLALRAEIARWALASYPHEACGLLLGRRAGARVEVEHVRSARNLDDSQPHERFELDPADHLAAEDAAAALGLDVVGVWHSHPDRPAIPSESDRSQAWSGWSYVIVSVGARGSGELRSWRLFGDRFQEEEVRVRA